MSNFKIILDSSDPAVAQRIADFLKQSSWPAGRAPDVESQSLGNALEWMPGLTAFRIEPMKGVSLLFAYSGDFHSLVEIQLVNYRTLVIYAMQHHPELKEHVVLLPEFLRIEHQNDYETIHGFCIEFNTAMGIMEGMLKAQEQSNIDKREMLEMLSDATDKFMTRSSELHDLFNRGAIMSGSLLELTEESLSEVHKAQRAVDVKLEEAKDRFSSQIKDCETRVESMLKTVRAKAQNTSHGVNPEIWIHCESMVLKCQDLLRNNFGRSTPESSPVPQAPGAAGFFSSATASSSSTSVPHSGPVYDPEDSDIEILSPLEFN